MAILPFAAFLITFVTLKGLLKSRLSHSIMDNPTPRSLHGFPVPRTGGIAVMAGVLITAAVGVPSVRFWFLVAGLLAVVSFFDDWRGLPALVRLAVHFLGTGVFAALAFPHLAYFWIAAIILGTVWMTNLYNFMDGSDGLAGGMALFGFGFYGLAAWLAGAPEQAAVYFSIAAANAAFLLFNFHPARIFLGDVGSIPLGFLAASMGFLGWRDGFWPLWFPVLVFSPFVVDASVTLVKRLLRREKVWHAHKEHYYQRLVRMGWGHRHTALAEYGLMVGVGTSAVWGAFHDRLTQVAILVCWIVLLGMIMLVIDWRWKEIMEGVANQRSYSSKKN